MYLTSAMEIVVAWKYLPSVALIEMSLIYRSRSMELEEDLRILLSLFNGRTTQLTPLEAMRAVWIRRE